MSTQMPGHADLQNEVVPFYFGISPKSLYGCYHPPQVSRGKAFAVVVCSAIGQEYLQSHRAIYQLAVLLSRAGFHVLRFDYFGCGDSEGQFEEGSVLQWTDDIHIAIAEMQKQSGLTRICLIGLRMGATLALQAAANCPHVDTIILWEPVLRGDRYLQELAEGQRAFLDAWRHKIKQSEGAGEETPAEFIGFPITSDMRRELETINAAHIKIRSGVRLLAVSNSEESNELNHFIESHPRAQLQVIADQHKVWKEFYRRLTPHNTLLYMVRWVDNLQS